MYWSYLPMDAGVFQICSDGSAITAIRLLNAPTDPAAPCALTELAAQELSQYLTGTRTAFTFPIAPGGTPFQKQVWNALRSIPYGRTKTYGQIAAAIGRPKATRAVGSAVSANPVLIAVPCHRVLPADGSIGNFSALGGAQTKKWLLALEQGAKNV